MPRGKFRFTGRRKILPRRQRRIIIPQPVERPISIHQRDLVKTEFLGVDPDTLTIHRRGVQQPKVGEDPLEARAVPKSRVKGTLPERIIYRWLEVNLNWRDGAEFDFQSALQGGRLELGGIVADFLIKFMGIVLNPLGPTHNQFLRKAKDEEQRQALAEMGYTQYEIPEKDVYNEPVFENWMREVLGLNLSRRAGGIVDNAATVLDANEDFWRGVLGEIQGAGRFLVQNG